LQGRALSENSPSGSVWTSAQHCSFSCIAFFSSATPKNA